MNSFPEWKSSRAKQRYWQKSKRQLSFPHYILLGNVSVIAPVLSKSCKNAPPAGSPEAMHTSGQTHKESIGLRLELNISMTSFAAGQPGCGQRPETGERIIVCAASRHWIRFSLVSHSAFHALLP
jgi:hypothetical protein